MKPMPWWRWIAATFAILAGWVYGAAVIAAAFDVALAPELPWQKLMVELAPFVAFFIATPAIWRLVTGTSVAHLINVRGRIEASRIGVGFAAWIALSAAATGIDAVIHSSDYRYTFSAASFVPFAIVTLILLPVQCWSEELFFRGWVLRWAERRSIAAKTVISGAVFALPHLGNPEASGQAALALAAWFLLGAGWAYVSARDGGIELAMGAHLANNVFSLLFVGYDDAALPTSAIFTTSSVDIAATTISLLVMVPLFAQLTRRAQVPAV